MLKKIVKDERGSAFIIAILTMIIAVILCASFSESVATSTRLESNATKMDESYLIAKSGMLYFEQVVRLNGWSKADVLSKFSSPVKGVIEGYDPSQAYFTIEVANRTADDEYNIISTGYYGTGNNAGAYKLYKYSFTDSDGGGKPKTESTPKADLLDYATSSFDKTLWNGYEGSYYILNDEPGGKLTITNTDNAGLHFGKLVTVTDVEICVGGSDFGQTNRLPDAGTLQNGIISKGNFKYNGSNINIIGSLYVNEFNCGGNGKGLTVNGDVMVATEMNDVGQMDDYRDYLGNVLVAGDCTFGVSGNERTVAVANEDGTTTNQSRETVYIQGDLVVGGDLYINFGGSASSLYANNIIVKGDVYISGSGTLNIGSNLIYIKNGSLTPPTLKTVDSSSATAVAYFAKYFANDDSNPDFVMYKDITKKIDIEFPVASKPVTTLPDSVKDGASGTLVVSSLSDLGAPEIIEDYEGTKRLYRLNQDAIFAVDLNQLLQYNDVIILIEAATGPELQTVEGKTKPKNSDGAIDIRFKENFYITADNPGDDAPKKGGRIWVDDNGHSGCIRFFMDAGKQIRMNSAHHWAVEPLTTPLAGTNTSNAKQYCEVKFDNNYDGIIDATDDDINQDGLINDEDVALKKFINYDYVPNLYFFSLNPESSIITNGSFIHQSGCQIDGEDATSKPCFPGYVVTPNLAYRFGGSTTGYLSNSGPVTWDNAPKVHGVLNSADNYAEDAKACYVKGCDPDSDTVYTNNQAWLYEYATYGVYGYGED